MSITRLRLTLSPSHAGRRLDAALADWLPAELGRGLSKSAVRRIIMAGAVLIDGRPVRRPGQVLQLGQRLEARVDLGRLAGVGRTGGDLGPAGLVAPDGPVAGHLGGLPGIDVLFKDRWLLAVAKPAGLLVHASADPGRPDLFSILTAGLTASFNGALGSKPYLGLHHRLDLETSGVMLFAIDPAANAALGRAFADHRVEKVYHAIVARPVVAPPMAWVERGPLALVGGGRRARMTVVPGGGMASETAFAIRDLMGAALIIEARPSSGRKHQVRAHLAARGLPIFGDVRYGGATVAGGAPVPRVMLHARALRLLHPVLGTPLEIGCPWPDDFRALVARLGGSLDSHEGSR